MAEDFEVKLEILHHTGTLYVANDTETTQLPLNLPYSINWAGFRNQVALYLKSIEEINQIFPVEIKYIDEDGDEIVLSSEEELQEAMKIAHQNCNALRVIVKYDDSVLNDSNSEKILMPHHVGVTCDGCEKSIVGVRYKCGNCPDFDLCEICENVDGIHDPSHIFLKIKRPTRGLGIQSTGQPVPLLGRDISYVIPIQQATIEQGSHPALPSENTIHREGHQTQVNEVCAKGSTVQANEETKGDAGDDWSLCSSLSVSDSEEDDSFFIVPLPNCFIPERSNEENSTTNVVVMKDELSCSDSEMTLQKSLSGMSLQNADVAKLSHLITPSDNAKDDSDVMLIKNHSSSSVSLEEITATETPNISLTPESEENLPNATDSSIADRDTHDDIQIQGANLIPSEELYPKNRQERSMHGTTEKSNLSRSPSDLATSVLNSAMEAASTAASAALTTAKDVFNTLQAQSKYMPPQSSYTPPQQIWVPTTEVYPYPPQGASWIPPPDSYQCDQDSTWAPQDHDDSSTNDPESAISTGSPMDKLIEMGFANRNVNAELLHKHQNDIDKVLEELLVSTDSLWYDSRH